MIDPKQEIIQQLAQAVRRGGHSLNNVPAMLLKVIEDESWKTRYLADDSTVNLTAFREFIELDYPIGLGTTIETLDRLCGHEPKIKAALVDAKRQKPGRPSKVKNSDSSEYVDSRGNVKRVSESETLTPSRSDTLDYAMQRLKDESANSEDVSELYRQVLAGELSANGAMIRAGFRRSRISVFMDDAESAANSIQGYMERDVAEDLIGILQRRLDDSEDFGNKV